MRNEGTSLLSPSDIAELAGVARPVVSNWRKRHLDFPLRAGGTESKPLFNKSEIDTWLRNRGYEPKSMQPGARLGVALNVLRDRVTYRELTSFVMLLATVRKASPQKFTALAAESDANRMRSLGSVITDLRQQARFSQLEDVPASIVPLGENASEIVAAIAEIDVDDLADAIDDVLERLSKMRIKGGAYLGFVGSRTSDMLVSLVGQTEGTVYDPACGIANVLVRVGQNNRKARLVGSDVWPEALDLAWQRAFLRDLSIELTQVDLLSVDPDPDFQADVIVAEPPFGMGWDSSKVIDDPRFRHGLPSRSAADLAWVLHAVAHLSKQGRAYVLTAPGALARSGSESRIRKALLAAGNIRAIVTLPPKLLPQTTIGPALWVLGPESECTEVLLIDATNEESPEHDIVNWLESHRDARVMQTIPHAFVAVSELLDHEAELVPQLWIEDEPVDQSDIVDSLNDSVRNLTKTITQLGTTSIQFANHARKAAPTNMTLGELIADGVVEIRAHRFSTTRSREMSDVDSRVGLHHIRQGILPPASAAVVNLSESVTQPGDILVATDSEIHAVVDGSGGHQVALGVAVIAVRDQSVLLPEYLAAAICGVWNEKHIVGLSRKRFRDLVIPMIPLEEQQTVVSRIDELMGIVSQADALNKHAINAQKRLLETVRHNISLP